MLKSILLYMFIIFNSSAMASEYIVQAIASTNESVFLEISSVDELNDAIYELESSANIQIDQIRVTNKHSGIIESNAFKRGGGTEGGDD